jgi:hypothetical protein
MNGKIELTLWKKNSNATQLMTVAVAKMTAVGAEISKHQ